MSTGFRGDDLRSRLHRRPRRCVLIVATIPSENLECQALTYGGSVLMGLRAIVLTVSICLVIFGKVPKAFALNVHPEIRVSVGVLPIAKFNSNSKAYKKLDGLYSFFFTLLPSSLERQVYYQWNVRGIQDRFACLMEISCGFTEIAERKSKCLYPCFISDIMSGCHSTIYELQLNSGNISHQIFDRVFMRVQSELRPLAQPHDFGCAGHFSPLSINRPSCDGCNENKPPFGPFEGCVPSTVTISKNEANNYADHSKPNPPKWVGALLFFGGSLVWLTGHRDCHTKCNTQIL